MIARIHSLSPHVANQIAAGEVIERPASVVKELLENALDAQATEIQVDIHFGGLTYIRISDNGAGIVADDLALAIMPHATSKLCVLDDLSAIDTMGFRGEALASIASISRMTLQSRPHGQTHAMQLQADEFGMHFTPCARNLGTTIEVRDLFFNAPVRKKFLKSETLEFLAIEAVVRRFALCEPTIALKLTHDDKLCLDLPAATDASKQARRLQKLLGKAFMDDAIYLDVKHGDLHLHGWVSSPNYARSQQDKQWIYINRRMVKDKLMLHAFKVAYEGLIHPGRYPSCLLYLVLPAAQVDVNVHPTKHEVRFSQPRVVHDFIYSSVAALMQTTEFQTSKPEKTILTKPARATFQDVSDHHSLPAWMVLNRRYLLLTHDDQVHLVDITQVRQQVLLSHLAALAVPWASRPLLVDVSIVMQEDCTQLLAHYGVVLNSLGFVFKIDGPRIQVQAIPRDLPALHLSFFFEQLLKHQPPTTEIIKFLIQAETWDFALIAIEEQQTWMRHALDLIQQEGSDHISVRLDEQTCQALLNG